MGWRLGYKLKKRIIHRCPVCQSRHRGPCKEAKRKAPGATRRRGRY